MLNNYKTSISEHSNKNNFDSYSSNEEENNENTQKLNDLICELTKDFGLSETLELNLPINIQQFLTFSLTYSTNIFTIKKILEVIDENIKLNLFNINSFVEYGIIYHLNQILLLYNEIKEEIFIEISILIFFLVEKSIQNQKNHKIIKRSNIIFSISELIIFKKYNYLFNILNFYLSCFNFQFNFKLDELSNIINLIVINIEIIELYSLENSVLSQLVLQFPKTDELFLLYNFDDIITNNLNIFLKFISLISIFFQYQENNFLKIREKISEKIIKFDLFSIIDDYIRNSNSEEIIISIFYILNGLILLNYFQFVISNEFFIKLFDYINFNGSIKLKISFSYYLISSILYLKANQIDFIFKNENLQDFLLDIIEKDLKLCQSFFLVIKKKINEFPQIIFSYFENILNIIIENFPEYYEPINHIKNTSYFLYLLK